MSETHYGRAIRGLRMAQGLTAEQLGQRCDPEMSSHQMNYLEGQQSIQLRKLERICGGLKVDPKHVLDVAREAQDEEVDA